MEIISGSIHLGDRIDSVVFLRILAKCCHGLKIVPKTGAVKFYSVALDLCCLKY